MPLQNTQIDAGEAASSDAVRPAKTRTVLFVTWTPSYGGSEKHLLDLISRFDEGEARLLILCANGDPYTERLNGCAAKVRVICEPGLESAREYFRVFRETKPDVVVFVYGWLDAFPWYASAVARLAGIRRIYAIQHLIPRPLPPKVEVRSLRNLVTWFGGERARYLLGVRVAAYLCGKTICVSNAVERALVNDYRFPPKRTRTVHNGVPVAQFVSSRREGVAVRARLGLRADEFVLVCTARLSHEKGIDILLSAVSLLMQRGLPCKCIIVGEGYLRGELVEQMQRLGLMERVFLVGFQEDVRPYLSAANAFVLTSHMEGLPFSVLEAMACGLPCVLTNVGGNGEAVAQGVNGLVVNPGSAEEVAEAIAYLLANPQECARMSLAARSRAESEFDVATKMAEIKQVILN